MANKARKKSNKNLIIGCCIAAVVVIAAIITAVILINRSNSINDDYFVSDGSKYVITVDSEDLTLDDDETDYAPLKTHLVYTYSGDEITGLKSYYEYENAEAASKAFDKLKEEAGDDIEEVVLNGKYVVATAKADQYEGMTASDVKQQIEFIEMLKNMNVDTDNTTDTDSSENEANADDVEDENAE